MILLTLIVIAVMMLVAIALLGRRSIRYFGVTLLIALALQYGPWPFLDEKGRAELLMWQLVSLPIIASFSLVLTGCIWGAVWLGKRVIARHESER